MTKQNENAQPVDLLALLDPDIRDPHSGAIVGQNADIAAARDAVRELIEAARELQFARDTGRQPPVRCWDALRNALGAFTAVQS